MKSQMKISDKLTRAKYGLVNILDDVETEVELSWIEFVLFLFSLSHRIFFLLFFRIFL